jgi:hypothetical protein
VFEKTLTSIFAQIFYQLPLSLCESSFALWQTGMESANAADGAN